MSKVWNELDPLVQDSMWESCCASQNGYSRKAFKLDKKLNENKKEDTEEMEKNKNDNEIIHDIMDTINELITVLTSNYLPL